MNRRGFFSTAAQQLRILASDVVVDARADAGCGGGRLDTRSRPGDSAWPSEASWDRLGRDVEGRLRQGAVAVRGVPGNAIGLELRASVQGIEEPLLSRRRDRADAIPRQVDAWNSRPSAYAVAAKTKDDVVAAVDFARQNKLRLVVRRAEVTVTGTSNAADSLLMWTRRMNVVTMHEAFVGAGCAGNIRRSRRSLSKQVQSRGRSMTSSRQQGGRVRSRRRLHDRGRCRHDSKRGLRKFFQVLRDGCGGLAGG